MVRQNALTLIVHDPEVSLGIGVALIGGKAEPLHRFFAVR